jgi:hypothetical protein
MMDIPAYAEALRNPALKPYEDGWYQSRTTGRQGYKAVFTLGKVWYRYTVSDMTRKVSPLEVADAITSPSSRVSRPGGGYKKTASEATVRLDGHSYMLNVSDSKR